MKILAVDTALGACSVAVLSGEQVLSHRYETMERGHAEALAPMVQRAMQAAEVSFADLERLAVTTGPGTFTGQRVGLAFMRGLRLALKLPLIGVTTLETMARTAMEETSAPFGAALHDAKRGEVYVGLYARGSTLLHPALLPLDSAVQNLRDALSGRGALLALAGTASGATYEQYLALGCSAVATSISAPDALWVAKLGQEAAASSEAPRPLYLRPPDARLPARTA
jgi:tRNA threonylcarbamoyladenosine biosynthesis protein TsaB